MHRTANPATPVRLRARPPAAARRLGGTACSVGSPLPSSLSASAAPHGRTPWSARPLIGSLENDLVYSQVSSSAALRAWIVSDLPRFAEGDAWDKLTLGFLYKALASWEELPGAPAVPEGAPDGIAQAPAAGSGAAGSDRSPGTHHYYYRPSQSQSQAFQGTPQAALDYARQAITWLKAAATDGLSGPSDAGRSSGPTYRRAGAIAALALGEIYAFGVIGRVQSKGIVPDYVEAFVWFSVAAREKEERAAENLAEVTALLSADQRAEAETRLRALTPLIGN